jgi:hypothetical protein
MVCRIDFRTFVHRVYKKSVVLQCKSEIPYPLLVTPDPCAF